MQQEDERKGIFAERLKQAAIAKYGKEHSSRTRLAEDVGVSIQAASKWLRGDTMPKPEYWGVIAAKLGVTAQWLVGGTHEPPPHLADIPDESLDLASRAARIVFPLINRLQPGADQQTFDTLFRHAYQELKAGRDEQAVAGDIASRLI